VPGEDPFPRTPGVALGETRPDAAAAASGTGDRRGPRSLTFREHLWGFLKELVVVVVGAIIVAALIRGLVGQMFLIPSSSMENTLLIQDRVVVEKLSTIKRGQVVVFADPGGWLSGSEPQERGRLGQALEFVGVLPDTGTGHLIKRVVGLPGDQVICCDSAGRISVNGRPLDETGYLYPQLDEPSAPASTIRFDVVVPAGRIFVLGDNRADSRDSRCHLNDDEVGAQKGENAFVAEDLVVGRAVAVVWPTSSAARLRTPATYETVPPGESAPPARAAIKAGPDADC
jgi:signal peptidase I